MKFQRQESMMNRKSEQYQQIIEKCWADEAFKQRLLADPAGTLNAEGVTVPAGVSVRVVENTAQVVHLVIPCSSTELSDQEISQMAGGASIESQYIHK
jgi:hypothetical protein